ncbi:MAG TPA: sensor histidine kinase, partial [Alphaproteobacteria bacterium]|nr:sensor histidine kinase [Alphaproteobacteria bacterium]
MPLVDFELLTSSAPGAVLLVTPTGEIVAFNAEARNEFPGVTGRKLMLLTTDAPEQLLSYLRDCTGHGSGLLRVVPMRTLDGLADYRCVGALARPACGGEPPLIVLRLSPKRIADHGFVLLNEQVRHLDAELHQRMLAQQSLERALRDKDLLLREIHHRVKNNLQVIVSILSFQIRQEETLSARQTLEKARRRIHAMGAVQTVLYRSPHVDAIDAADLLKELSSGLWDSIGPPNVKLELAVDSELLGADVASALGVIANELVTNALKHAFPDQRPGTVRIAFRRGREDRLVFSIQDNGVGFDPVRLGTGLGLNFVEAMASNIG